LNVLTLIQQHPLLQADLVHQGVPYKTLGPLADSIALQLGSSADNLSQLFSKLTYAQCMDALDAGQVAQASGISAPAATAALQSVAAFIDEYELHPCAPYVAHSPISDK